MIVYKFGGTSLADAERFAGAAKLVAECAAPPVVVVSAVAGVTDRLEKLARQAGARPGTPSTATGGPDESQGPADPDEDRRLGLAELRSIHHEIAEAIRQEDEDGDPADTSRNGTHPRPEIGRIDAVLAQLEQVLSRGTGQSDSPARHLDAVCAAGEDLSAELMVLALRQRGLRARAVDAREIIRTDGQFGRAIPLDEASRELARERLAPLIEAGEIPVLQGFVGATEDGTTTTLGRGGSDFTAALVGAALGARNVTIWTDVDGIYSADPNQVPDAHVLREIGYEEAVEISYFGAHVIHPAAAKHAIARDISLRIRNSFRPEDPGTLIRHDRRETPKVAAVACKPGVTLLKVRSRPLFMAHGFLARVFGVLASHELPVDLVATSHSSTAFTIDEEEELEAVIAELDAFAEVEVLQNLSTVSVVGRGLMGEPGISAKILSSLGVIPVYLISQASDVSLNFLVASRYGILATRHIHRALIADNPSERRAVAR